MFTFTRKEKTMEQRYTALRTIGSIYKVLGIIAGAITLLAVLGLGRFLGSFLGGGFLGILVMLIYGGGIALTLYAAGEGVFLLLALAAARRIGACPASRSERRSGAIGASPEHESRRARRADSAAGVIGP